MHMLPIWLVGALLVCAGFKPTSSQKTSSVGRASNAMYCRDDLKLLSFKGKRSSNSFFNVVDAHLMKV